MVDGYSAQQLRAAEAPHLAAGEPLMERAAAGLAREVRSVLADAVGGPTGRVLLLVGSGNNGGDALFAGAELAVAGCAVMIVEVGSRTHEAGLAAALAAGARVADLAAAGGETLVDAATIREIAAGVDVIVDGVLGTGAGAVTWAGPGTGTAAGAGTGSGAGGESSPALRGTARAVVAAILPALRAPGAPRVVAVDIPSGIGPDDGSVLDPTVLPADVTATFGAHKAGLLLSPARELAGDVRLIDIGLGPDLARIEPLVRVPR